MIAARQSLNTLAVVVSNATNLPVSFAEMQKHVAIIGDALGELEKLKAPKAEPVKPEIPKLKLIKHKGKKKAK